MSNNTPTKQTNVMDKFLTPLGLMHTGKGQRVTAMHTLDIPYTVLYMHLRLRIFASIKNRYIHLG